MMVVTISHLDDGAAMAVCAAGVALTMVVALTRRCLNA